MVDRVVDELVQDETVEVVVEVVRVDEVLQPEVLEANEIMDEAIDDLLVLHTQQVEEVDLVQ